MCVSDVQMTHHVIPVIRHVTASAVDAERLVGRPALEVTLAMRRGMHAMVTCAAPQVRHCSRVTALIRRHCESDVIVKERYTSTMNKITQRRQYLVLICRGFGGEGIQVGN